MFIAFWNLKLWYPKVAEHSTTIFYSKLFSGFKNPWALNFCRTVLWLLLWRLYVDMLTLRLSPGNSMKIFWCFFQKVGKILFIFQVSLNFDITLNFSVIDVGDVCLNIDRRVWDVSYEVGFTLHSFDIYHSSHFVLYFWFSKK